MQRVAGSDDVQIRRVAQHRGERREVQRLEIDLERAIPRELHRRGLRGVGPLLVAGDRGAQPSLQACVDPPRLALPGHRGEAPERRGDRQQREQQEVDDELELEATRCYDPHPVKIQGQAPSRRFLVRVMLSDRGGSSMRGIGRVLAAIVLAGAVAGTAAFAHLLGGGPGTMPFGIVALPPAPSEPLVVQAAPLPRATALAPAARPQLLHRSGVLHVGPADRTAPTVAHARPIVITPITAPSAPLPAAPGQAAATPAPAPATQPAAPSPVAAAPPADRVLAATAPVAVATRWSSKAATSAGTALRTATTTASTTSKAATTPAPRCSPPCRSTRRRSTRRPHPTRHRRTKHRSMLHRSMLPRAVTISVAL